MRIEHIPIVFGIIVAILGIALIADAWLPDEVFALRERRRRPRAERNRLGEGLVGAGVLCMAAALIGRDAWRWGTLTIILGLVLLGSGIALNAAYLKEALLFRGAARRRPEGDPARADADTGNALGRPASPPRPTPGPSDTGERERERRMRIR